ncbi:MAG: hypothetical protein AAGE01_05835 [Pseudomonadota bacterium]
MKRTSIRLMIVAALVMAALVLLPQEPTSQQKVQTVAATDDSPSRAAQEGDAALSPVEPGYRGDDARTAELTLSEAIAAAQASSDPARLPYPALRLLHDECTFMVAVSEDGGGFEALAGIYRSPIELSMRRAHYDACVVLAPQMAGIKTALASAADADTTGIALAETLFDLETDRGKPYAIKRARELLASSDSAWAGLLVNDYLYGADENYLHEARRRLEVQGHSQESIERVLTVSSTFGYCMSGGDCSPDGRVALNAICRSSAPSCGFDVVSALREHVLSSAEMSALEQLHAAGLAGSG